MLFFSDNLREALGISANQIPVYVYRMRMLGYPPGWLEHAKKQVSGLVLFDKHGKGNIILLYIIIYDWLNHHLFWREPVLSYIWLYLLSLSKEQSFMGNLHLMLQWTFYIFIASKGNVEISEIRPLVYNSNLEVLLIRCQFLWFI